MTPSSPAAAAAGGVDQGRFDLVVATDPAVPGVLADLAVAALANGRTVALLPLGVAASPPAPPLREPVLGGQIQVLLPGDRAAAALLVLHAGSPPPESVAADDVLTVPASGRAGAVFEAAGIPVPSVGEESTAKTVLFVSSNGSGMGHLTRILALARRASPSVQPHVLSLSQAVGVVGEFGIPFDYLPSRTALGVGPRAWNGLFEKRFRAVLDRLEPVAVVFDGSYPYEGIVRGKRRGTAYVWSRRPMWRPGAGAVQLATSRSFDLILEPGELAASRDQGLTARRRDALKVGPVVLLDESELLGADAARAELGLDEARPCALVTLGAGNINDLSSEIGLITEALAADPRLQICLTSAAIGAGEHVPQQFADRLHVLSTFPVSRYARAFDMAVAAAGYNSFHELIAFGVPSLYLPNRATALDDQEARAHWAAAAGVGYCLPEVTQVAVANAVADLRAGVRSGEPARRCRAIWPGNGADAAMRAIEKVAGISAGGRGKSR